MLDALRYLLAEIRVNHTKLSCATATAMQHT